MATPKDTNHIENLIQRACSAPSGVSTGELGRKLVGNDDPAEGSCDPWQAYFAIKAAGILNRDRAARKETEE